MVDQEGAILTDAATAPLSGRPHASVENVDYYYNKFGTLLGGGQKSDAIFMGTEILDLPPDTKKLQTLQYAISLSMTRLMDINSLNSQVPFVRHEQKGTVVYRNRQLQFELSYPAEFTVEDHFAGAPGQMTFAFLGINVGKLAGDPVPVAVAVTAQRIKTTFDDNIIEALANILTRRGVALKPMETALRAEGKQYKGSRTVMDRTYSEETIFLPNPKGNIACTVSFMCSDEHYKEYYPQFAAIVKSLRIGAIPPLKYVTEAPAGL